MLASDAGTCVTLRRRSFTADIVPLFNSCAGEVCHSFAEGAIVGEIGVPSANCCGELTIIDPGHPERSYVVDKLLGRDKCGGSRMPLGGSAFSADDIQTVTDWICQGAPTSP